MNELESWLPVPTDSDFSIYNLPFGIFSVGSEPKRIGIAIGELIVDIGELANLGAFNDLNINGQVFHSEYLNDFIELGKSVTNEVRLRIQNWLIDPFSILRRNDHLLVPQEIAQMHMPVRIQDYTDFYSSEEHATNVGKMFRDPENALLPNWKHLPVGYHGRSSSIIISGQNIHRPVGQTITSDGPVFGPTQRLDFELEMAFIIGKATSLGERVTTDRALEHIFGMVLFNDWSARDIQKWEYVPLGPFLSKSFASSISPWVVTIEALQPFIAKGPEQVPEVLSYLRYSGEQNYDINLSVTLTPEKDEDTIICRSNFRYMYWNMSQQLAHHTVNGCNINVGDMMASGTISGKEDDSFGSMLELSWGGSKSIKLNGGGQRKFIEDGDTVTMRGYAEKDNRRVGFGEVSATILPSEPYYT